jgi:deazaflavin-dependent oxidoreductase (nitroreductase family)
MELPRSLARFNKKVTNRVQGLWAPWLPPWAMVVHKGRKSGRSYRNPVLAFRSGDRLAVILFYGSRADWVRNVLAANEAEVIRANRTHSLTDPHLVPGTDPTLSPLVRRLAGRTRSVLLGTLSE